MSRTKSIIIISTFLIFSALFGFTTPANAQSQFNLLSVVTENCSECGACSVCDLLSVVTKGMRFMLSLSGALALAIFVYGGFELMMSQGKAEAVEHGKKMVTGTVVALGIILLMAWVWPNWVIIALKGIPAGGKPQTIFSNDAWWVTPCVKYQGTETCEQKPVSRPKLFASDMSGCVAVGADGRPSGSKPAGTTCPLGGACRQLPCVCDQNGSCVTGCATVNDCTKDQTLGVNYNYCRKFTTSNFGICEKVVPGTPCKSKSDCPNLEIFSVSSYSGGGPLRQVRVQFCNLVTEAADPRCRIVNGQSCETKSQCVPESSCTFGKCTPPPAAPPPPPAPLPTGAYCSCPMTATAPCTLTADPNERECPSAQCQSNLCICRSTLGVWAGSCK